MTQKQQLNKIEEINNNGLELLKSKGADYASEGDVLKNFKTMHVLINELEIDTTTLNGVHLFYILLKIQRISNLLGNKKTPKNESIQDTLIDLRNYVDLLNCSISDNQDVK